MPLFSHWLNDKTLWDVYTFYHSPHMSLGCIFRLLDVWRARFFFVSNSLFFISSSVFDLSLRSFPWALKEIFKDSFHELLCGKVSVFICLKMLTLKFPCWEQTPGFPSAPLCASRLHPCCLGSPGTLSASKVLSFIPGPLSHTLLSLPLFSALPM